MGAKVLASMAFVALLVAGGPVRAVEVAGADHNDAALLEGDELVAAVLDLARSLP